ncbi:SdpI family protein [Microbacterium gorillae]|uniref:SdpI family protein n=1 Tax=Microbacterium gorillae TaxID=1231063 RepID=UPI0006939EBF|nr:SdpI family protein [Microbacterium gorillae]
MEGAWGALAGAIVIGVGALLMLWLARRSAAGTLPRNQLAGIRTPLTLSSDEAWYPAQAAAAPATRTAALGGLIGSVAALVASVIVLVLGAEGIVPGLLCAGLLLAATAWLLVFVLIGAAAVLRAARDTSR